MRYRRNALRLIDEFQKYDEFRVAEIIGDAMWCKYAMGGGDAKNFGDMMGCGYLRGSVTLKITATLWGANMR